MQFGTQKHIGNFGLLSKDNNISCAVALRLETGDNTHIKQKSIKRW